MMLACSSPVSTADVNLVVWARYLRVPLGEDLAPGSAAEASGGKEAR